MSPVSTLRGRVFPAAIALFLLRCPDAALAARPVPAGDHTIGGRIAGEVRLSGRVRVAEDLLVLPGATLSLAPGTILEFERSDSTKVDPEFFFGGTELVVRGTLRADGARLSFPERTGGLVVDGGRAELRETTVSGAEAGLTILGAATVRIEGAVDVRDCRTGVALFPGRETPWEGDGTLTATGNAVGHVRFPGAPSPPRNFRAERNEEAEAISWAPDPLPGAASPAVPAPSAGARRLPDTFLDASRTLEGDVIVDGIVRVAPGATLTLLPGTRLFFTFRDTDGDGIGENGLFLQGNLRAKGTPERPVGFYPADGDARPGRWDSVNFMASETGENTLENVEIVGAYRGLHAHFSRFSAKDVRIARAVRGVQFQESEVSLAAVRIASSSSAIRCRDSNVRIDGLRVTDTVSGGNFFRSAVAVNDAAMDRTGWYGFRFRESRVTLSGGGVARALTGVSVQDGTVRAERVRIDRTGLAAAAVQEGDVKISGCRLTGALLDGLSAARGSVSVDGGEITGFGRHAVKLSGPAEVTLRGVSLPSPGGGRSLFLDGKSVPGLGVVRLE
jgi:hypothetical protein